MKGQFSLFVAASLIFQIWMFIDCLKRKENFFWILIIILFGPVGAALYLFFVKLSGSSVKIKTTIKDTEEVENLKTLIKMHGKAYHYNELGDIYLKRGDLQEAKECYEKAVKKGRLDDAIKSMRTLINNAGTLPDYKYQQEKIWIDKAHKFLRRYQKTRVLFDFA